MKYDQEPIEPTQRYIDALKELMRAELEMMRENEPDLADCWTWGVCTVDDIATNRGLQFEFGGDEDRPEFLPETMDILVKGL